MEDSPTIIARACQLDKIVTRAGSVSVVQLDREAARCGIERHLSWEAHVARRNYDTDAMRARSTPGYSYLRVANIGIEAK